jgi:hypothetical protein
MKSNVKMAVGLDILLHGKRLIRLEFAAGFLLSFILGLLSLVRSRGTLSLVLGVYLVVLSLNYAHLLLLALRQAGEPEYLRELKQRISEDPGLAVRLTRKSFLLLIPFSTIVPGSF